MRMRIPIAVFAASALGGCTTVPSTPPPAPAVPTSAATAPSASSGTGGAPAARSSDEVVSEPVDLRQVDWASDTIRMPTRKDDRDCPDGSITLTDGSWAESGDQGPGSIRGSYADGNPTYGDLDGDGRAEAVLYVSCLAAGGDSGDSSGQLLVVTGRARAPAGMGYVGPLAQVYGRLRISGGRLTVTVTQRYTDVRQERTYRWDGRRFTQTAGPTAFPSPPA
jgi:hypothetical protein